MAEARVVETAVVARVVAVRAEESTVAEETAVGNGD